MNAAAAVDHLVVAAAELEAGAAWLQERLGVKLADGGRHAAMGTHNRLLRLGQRCYLELIAIDPAAPPPGRPRWFGLDDPVLQTRLVAHPRLVHWVAGNVNAERACAACPEPLGELLELARDSLRWRITVPADGHLPGDGLLPSLIQWLTPVHPAERLPDAGCALMKLEGFHPEPVRIRSALESLGLGAALAVFPSEPGEAAGLVAYLETPAGSVELD